MIITSILFGGSILGLYIEHLWKQWKLKKKYQLKDCEIFMCDEDLEYYQHMNEKREKYGK